jgi:hypothetical protein
MGLVIKAIAAFCVGLAMLAGLQTAGLMLLQKYLKSERANAGLPRMGKTPDFATNFNAGGLQNALLPKYGMIDTREGQRLRGRGRGAPGRPDEPRRGERRAAAAADLRAAVIR